MTTPRIAFFEAVAPHRFKALWSGLYFPALPITPQDFALDAILPTMLYLARWGHRRGVGTFGSTFAPGQKKGPSVAQVAAHLGADHAATAGFDDPRGREALADLLLTWCLENRSSREGRTEPVQRAFPTHYFASWIDLPQEATDQRGVPELLTAILADQPQGESVVPDANSRGHFPVGVRQDDNHLLALFSRGTVMDGTVGNLKGDKFDETIEPAPGLGELLTIRMAQAVGGAPIKARGPGERSEIPNRRPIASRQARRLREDLSIFIRVYGDRVPKQAFTTMLEVGMALGLTQTVLATVALLDGWQRDGVLLKEADQSPWPLFVDATHGQNYELRLLSEAVMAEAVRGVERLPQLLALARVLDDTVRSEEGLRLPGTAPDPTAWFALLGDVLHERLPEAASIRGSLGRDCRRLADRLAASDPDRATHVSDTTVHPAWRLAACVVALMGDKPRRLAVSCLTSALLADRPHGLAVTRRVQRTVDGKARSVVARSVVLPSTALDYLVHRHVLLARRGNPATVLSLPKFLEILRERHGLYVDREPPGHAIPQEALARNRQALERQLRDLGLLVGVNDAEHMKRVQPRYQVEERDGSL